MIVTHIILGMFAAAGAWWLSGFDTRLTGEDRRADLNRRLDRCGVTLVLAVAAYAVFRWLAGMAGLVVFLLLVIPLAILWADCIAEFFARGFNRLIDPQDDRAFDPGKGTREQDRVAHLIRNGRTEEAARLCKKLKKTGDANVLVLETMLARAGIHQENPRKSKPLTVANQLRTEGKFGAAETILKSLLAENPSDADAALMLMRLYAHDMRRGDKAEKILQSLEKQPHIPSGHVEFARRSINEWAQQKPEPAAAALPESVDELLAGGYLGTAIEILERNTREQPRDFESWLKLAEAHGLYSGNIYRAEKIVQNIGNNQAFTPEQIQLAKARLAGWREAKPQGR